MNLTPWTATLRPSWGTPLVLLVAERMLATLLLALAAGTSQVRVTGAGPHAS